MVVLSETEFQKREEKKKENSKSKLGKRYQTIHKRGTLSRGHWGGGMSVSVLR